MCMKNLERSTFRIKRFLCRSRFISMNYFSNSTEYGIYEPHCGLDNIMISWGHDEYLYQVLKNHGSTIPEEGLAMIR